MTDKITDYRKAYNLLIIQERELRQRNAELTHQLYSLLNRDDREKAPPHADHYLASQYYKEIRGHLFVWRGGEWVRSQADLEELFALHRAEMSSKRASDDYRTKKKKKKAA